MIKKRIEGLWDCAFCGNIGIKSRYDSCPSCGKPRGIENIFYLPDDIDSFTLSKEEIDKTSNKPDWLCEYCGSYNRSDMNVCEKCGSDRSEASKDYGTIHKLTGILFNKKNME